MKVTIFASVDAVLAARLSDAAERKRVPQSAIVAWSIQHFLNEHEDVTITRTPGGNKGDADGMNAAARDFIQKNSAMTVPALVSALADLGIDRKPGWVTYARLEAKRPAG